MSAARRKFPRKKAADELESIEEQLDALEPVQDEELPTLEPIAAEEELPTLEPITDDEDLPVLEPIDEATGYARIECTLESAGDDEAYDVCLKLVVPELDRSEVPDAVSAALGAAAARHADALRLRRVVVRFSGEAMIPSATKERVAQALRDLRPLVVAVQRGYPDEIVLENPMPAASVRVDPIEGDFGRLRVTIDTADLVGAELGIVLQGDLDRLAAEAEGKSFELAFRGAARPDDALVDAIRSALAGGGATRATLQPADRAPVEVLFDRELEGLVAIGESSRDDCDAELELRPADRATIGAALDLVLPPSVGLIRGRRVRLRAQGAESLVELVVERLAALGAARVELDRGAAGADLLLPRLLRTASKDDRTKIGVVPGDRDRAALFAALRRELPALRHAVHGHRIAVEWPDGTVLDEELEKVCVTDGLAPLGAKSVVFRAGDQSLPVWPAPLTFRRTTDGYGELVVAALDTDAGRPVELVAAVERRLRAHTQELRGRRVRFELTGEGAVSRTVRRTVFDELERAGVKSAELVERDAVDVLLPRLLKLGAQHANELRIAIEPAWRNEEQVSAALARELEALELPANATLVVDAAGEPASALVTALVARGAERVLLGGAEPVQVHPALFAAPARPGERAVLSAQPSPDDAVVVRQLQRELPARLAELGDLQGVSLTLQWPGARKPFGGAVAAAIAMLRAAEPAVLRVDGGAGGRPVQVLPEVVRRPVAVLGRRDSATPPMRLIGIEWTEDDDEIAITLRQLDALRDELAGARVLVTFLDHDGRDAPPHADDEPLVAAVCGALGDTAALLLHRDVAGDSVFEVVRSAVDGLAVGQRYRDPRGAAVPVVEPPAGDDPATDAS
ncbi:MAG: hypothetical protein IPM29_30420 [Planctomycetes bacterium]|nr:hypothetical protein [Planctomycetota bacterium]